ncbi:hypothetical protein [Burkholderia sp. Ac-20365]|uniref:hypothetical protein n=1 Tax=Burkholderia sp. Ac-20365 TaxID=2703897 RepID=UPI00197C1A56|nr:hypothetical protein [Burkholderia sp. Ac-20365]
MAIEAASVNVNGIAKDKPNDNADRRARDIDAIRLIAVSPLSLRTLPLCASALSRAGGMNNLFSFLLVIVFEHHCLSSNPSSRSLLAAGRLAAQETFSSAPYCLS